MIESQDEALTGLKTGESRGILRSQKPYFAPPRSFEGLLAIISMFKNNKYFGEVEKNLKLCKDR